MNKQSLYKWYLLDILVFALINLLIWHYQKIEISAVLLGMDWMTLFILALGIWRLTDIVTHEHVTDVVRAPFEGAEYGFRGFLGTLVSCNACMGVWVSMIVFYCYLFFQAPTMAFMFIMTLTGFERFFSKIYNVLEGHEKNQ